MKIQNGWKAVAVVALFVLFAAMTMVRNADGTELPLKENQCCQENNSCREEEQQPANGESIIWDSMSDNLLSARL